MLLAEKTSEATLSRWREQIGGMKPAEAKHLMALEDTHRRLKQLVADHTLDIQTLKQLSEGNWQATPAGESRWSSFG
ncbi:MAG: hypothetical protein RLZZ326_1842 [Planctomycetota bacterium]